MENQRNTLVFFLLILLYITNVNSVELTFELVDNAKDCFYQEIEKNQTATLEFQVRFLNILKN